MSTTHSETKPVPTFDLTNFENANLALDPNSKKQGAHAITYRLMEPFLLLLPIVQITSIYGSLEKSKREGNKGFDRIKYKSSDKTARAGIKASLFERPVTQKLEEFKNKLAASCKEAIPDFSEDGEVHSLFNEANRCGFIDPYISTMATTTNKTHNIVKLDFFHTVVKDQNGAVKRIPAPEYLKPAILDVSWECPATGEARIAISRVSVNTFSGKTTYRLNASLEMFTMGMYPTNFLLKHFPSNVVSVDLEEVASQPLEGVFLDQLVCEEGLMEKIKETFQPVTTTKSSKKRPVPADVTAELAVKKTPPRDRAETLKAQIAKLEMEEELLASRRKEEAKLAALKAKLAAKKAAVAIAKKSKKINPKDALAALKSKLAELKSAQDEEEESSPMDALAALKIRLAELKSAQDEEEEVDMTGMEDEDEEAELSAGGTDCSDEEVEMDE